jgi:hypothetical protein
MFYRNQHTDSQASICNFNHELRVSDLKTYEKGRESVRFFTLVRDNATWPVVAGLFKFTIG